MNQTRITEHLSIITGDPQGITVQYFAVPDDGGTVDVYAVSLAWKSVKKLAKEIRRNDVRFVMNDRSLSIFGNNENGLEFSFRSSYGTPGFSNKLSLNPEESQKFVDEILKLGRE